MNHGTTLDAEEVPVFPEPDHDHDACVSDALTRADEICAERGARLTALRRAVLEIVWASHAPIGAYEILDRLQTARRADNDEPARAAPPTVYRALDFLLEHGLAHRIESLNGLCRLLATGRGSCRSVFDLPDMRHRGRNR